jgi:predicted nucleotidyltransferase
MVAMSMESSASFLAQLEKRLGTQFLNIKAARELSQKKRSEITEKLEGIPSSDTSIMILGSLARDEFTEGSDIDWTLLVDGSADPEHLEVANKVGGMIADFSSKSVGREGTFGSLTFSHNLIHQIGGEADTNRNTTQRILLLLESCVLGRD